MNKILPNLTAEVYNSAPINGARYVYDRLGGKEKAIMAGVEAPENTALTDHEEAAIAREEEAAKIKLETNSAVREATRTDTNHAPSTNETKGETTQSPEVEVVEDKAETEPEPKKRGPIRQTAHNIVKYGIKYPYWALTKGIPQWANASKPGQWVNRMGTKMSLFDSKLMDKPWYPYGVIQLPYWLVTRPPWAVGHVTVKGLGALGNLFPDIDKPK